MIRNRKQLLLCVGVCVFCVINIILTQKTWATTCSGITVSSNASLRKACDCGSSACGAMWLSDKPSATDVSSQITVSDSEWNSGTKTVYLHGAILYGWSAMAEYVWISQGTSNIETYDDYLDASMFNGFSSDSLMRLYNNGMNRTGNLYPYNSDINSSVVSLTLDLKALKRSYGTQGNYNIPLQIFRCFEGYYPSDHIPSNCYSDTSYLNISVPTNTVDNSVTYQGMIRALGTKDLNVEWERWVKNGDGWSATTNWSGNSDFVRGINKVIRDCPNSGCYVQFRHYLWASKFGTRGIYQINRFISHSDWTMDQCKSDASLSQTDDGRTMTGCYGPEKNWFWHPETGTIESSSDWFVNKSYVKLYPGETVCDVMNFRKKFENGKYDDYGNDQVSICVTAENSLGGVTRAVGSIDTDTGWDDLKTWKKETRSGNDLWTMVGGDSSEVSYDINDCPASGCPVQFRHYLKNPKANKGAAVYYKIERTINANNNCNESDAFCKGIVTCNKNKSCVDAYNIKITDDMRGKDTIVNVSNSGEGDIKIYTTNNNAELQRDPLIIYPGQTVCETLYFKENSSDSYSTYTKACVTAMGNMGPSIDVKVSNDTMNTGYQEEVYAKPDDKLTYEIKYKPGLQYAADLIVGDAVINNAYVDNSGKKDLKTLFNSGSNGGFNWNNAYRVDSTFEDTRFKHSTIYDVGDNGEKTEYIEYGKVNDGDVRDIKETAIIDPVDDEINPTHTEVWSTPKAAGFTREGGKLRAYVVSQNGKINDFASSAVAYVPYNFENTVEIGDVNDVLYSGQSGSITYAPKVNKRWNSTTQAEYATMVKKPKVRVCVHLDGEDECLNENSEQSGGDAWNVSSNSGGSSEASKTISFPVPDYPAGTKMCADVSVYPANSGESTNWSDEEGSRSWSNPVSKCFTIAKRPSFQVWGGSVSAKSISAPVAEKMNLGGYSFDKAAVFGSWAELAVVTKIRNDDGTENTTNKKAMASGAGLGYDSQINGKLWPDPSPSEDEGLGNNPKKADASSYEKPGGGMRDIDYTNLTFNGGGGVIVPTLAEVKSALGINETAVEEGHTLSRREDITETTLFYDTNTIKITGEIMVKRGTYSSLESVPKVVIYSDGGINIECSVRRIDAILIANGDINTCSNPGSEGNIKKAANAQEQLTINGAIIVGKKSSDENGERTLLLNRTYGAATGNNSIVPAEIINYDNSMMFIGGGSASTGASVDPSKLEVQHIRELAPRY